MKNNQPANIIVHDIRGQICPSCLLYTLREINRQKAAFKEGNTRIIIKTDNRDATTTIPDAVSSMGYECLVEKKKGYYELVIVPHRKKTIH
ncbi:MAG: sulfurtransferase TusA family protein [Desulfobulbaceae bacterium]|nr:sulfurtransferase TusA family protein [Desulfobulbaceae bacterium]